MSASKRKFYKTIIQIEVLSETPYSSTDLEKINEDITNGAQSGHIEVIVDSEVLDSKTCVKSLKAQGSDPEFFCLDIHGNDTEDYFDEDSDKDDDYLNDGKIKKLKKDK